MNLINTVETNPTIIESIKLPDPPPYNQYMHYIFKHMCH